MQPEYFIVLSGIVENELPGLLFTEVAVDCSLFVGELAGGLFLGYDLADHIFIV